MFSINKTVYQLRELVNIEHPPNDLYLPGSTDKYLLIGVAVHKGLDSVHYYAIVKYKSGIFKSAIV